MQFFINVAIAVVVFFSCWVNPVMAADLSNSQTEILATLEAAPVVYLGEIHDNETDHDSELTILTELYRRNRDLTLGFEMFQRPFQLYLTQYLLDEISESDLRDLTEYDDRWRFDWEFYAPLLRFAKVHHLPIVALNTPAEITNIVATEGLDNLDKKYYRYIPDRENLDFSNQDYLDDIKASFLAHIDGDYGNQAVQLENFTAAQILWDETMAEAIADYSRVNSGQQFIAFVGQAHIYNNYGIPDRVARRIPEIKPLQITVFLSSDQPQEDIELADFIWSEL